MKKKIKKLREEEGFTLIELLVVISIISVLSVVVFVALDPIKRFRDSRNSRRINDVNNIMTAIQQYITDNGGSLPSGISAGGEWQLGTCSTGGTDPCGTGAEAECLDLSVSLEQYLKSIPEDPQAPGDGRTYYSVQVDGNNMVTVKACNSEGGEEIQVSR